MGTESKPEYLSFMPFRYNREIGNFETVEGSQLIMCWIMLFNCSFRVMFMIVRTLTLSHLSYVDFCLSSILVCGSGVCTYVYADAILHRGSVADLCNTVFRHFKQSKLQYFSKALFSSYYK